MSKKGKSYNWDDVRWNRKAFMKKKGLNPRRDFPTPFKEEDRFLIEVSRDNFFILTVLSIHKEVKYKTYLYNMNIEEFDKVEEDNSPFYLWKSNTPSPIIITRAKKGFVAHSLLAEYENKMITLEEYAKIILTKDEVCDKTS